MRLAENAPWPLPAAVLVFGAGLLPVPVSDALIVRSSPQRLSRFTLLSIDQVPGPTPQWVDYGPPQVTTFNNLTSACKACIQFFPEKQDGERFHSASYEDTDGGVWPRICRAGSCDFRDPQMDPVGGIIGKGVGPGRTPDGKSCITRDPVPWYGDCEPVVKASVESLVDITRYCSYREQIFIPPPLNTVSHFSGGKGKAWARIGGTQDQCMQLIEKQGSNLMDTMTFCDTDLPALSGCCETVFSALNCVAETSTEKGLWNNKQGSVFMTMNKEGTQMLETFAKYCVPLCQNTKEEFCEKYPHADICVSHSSCSDCTAAGGLWCPKLESCHCPGPEPPCVKLPVTAPLQCLPVEEMKGRKGLANEAKKISKAKNKRSKEEEAKEAAEAAKEVPAQEALCKYAKFAQTWLPKDREQGGDE